MPYEVQTPQFEGPFDLLLHLIVREEVDLYEVSLSAIVDAYLAEIDLMGALDLELATEFLVIAATLVELKCRRLLPGAGNVDLDDDLSLFEERDLLLARLVEAKTFKDAGAALARMADTAGLSHPRTAGLEEPFLALVPDLLEGLTSADIAAAYERATAPKPPPPRIDLDHVAPIRLSVSETVAQLAATLVTRGPETFRRLTEGLPGRLEVIVHFLAVLELYKQGRVQLEQSGTFGELRIEWVDAEGDWTRDGIHADLTTVDSYDG